MRNCNPIYSLFKKWLRLTHETLLVRRRYVVGRENIPQRGERYFIVSNHENTANDPLNIIFSLPNDLPVGSLARANMFELSGGVTRFLHFLRILPAYRYDWESAESLSKNLEIGKEMSQRVNSGEPFIVFPSAGHSQGHYLLSFTTGVVRMALQAIADNGWKYDVKILPTALFYADYNAPRSDVEWIIGEPVSLLQYKDMYKDHPYTVMREVRDLLWERVHGMMLDEGEEDYLAVDFLRRAFSDGNVRGMKLPDRLAADKKFIAKLRSNNHYGMLTALARAIMKREKALGVDESNAAQPMSIPDMMPDVFCLFILLPLWIVSLWPHLLCYRLPLLLLKDDKMFTNSYRYIISALFIYPLAAIVTFIAFAVVGWWLAGLLWIVMWIPLGIFCWNYWRRLSRFVENIKLRQHPFAAAKILVMHEWAKRMLNDSRGK